MELSFQSAMETHRKAFEEFARNQSEVSSLQRKPMVPFPTFLPKSNLTTTMLVSLYCYFPFTCYISSFFSFCIETSKKNGHALIKHLWYREIRQIKRHINARRKPVVFCPHFHEMQSTHWGTQGFLHLKEEPQS